MEFTTDVITQVLEQLLSSSPTPGGPSEHHLKGLEPQLGAKIWWILPLNQFMGNHRGERVLAPRDRYQVFGAIIKRKPVLPG